MPPRRWLWPCSDSQVLRMPAYQEPSVHACLLHPQSPSHVLVADSDDDLDDDQDSAKRRRIEAIAHSYLQGKPIFIATARLKGPFPVDQDLAFSHEPFSTSALETARPASTVNARTFIRRTQRKSRRQSNSPDPVPTPSKAPLPLPPSSAHLEKRPSLPQSSRLNSRSAKRKALRFDLPSSAKSLSITFPSPALPQTATKVLPVQRRHTPSSAPASGSRKEIAPSLAIGVSDTNFFSPSPSPSKDAASRNTSLDTGSVLKQRPASHLNKVKKPSSASPKHTKFKKNKPLLNKVYHASAALDSTSPFLYRRNGPPTKRVMETTEAKSPENIPTADVGQKPEAIAELSHLPNLSKRRQSQLHNCLDGFLSTEPKNDCLTAASPKSSPERIEPDHAPAINMSFGQESLGMNFDIINHFNQPPSGSGKKKDHQVSKDVPEFSRSSASNHIPEPLAIGKSPSINADVLQALVSSHPRSAVGQQADDHSRDMCEPVNLTNDEVQTRPGPMASEQPEKIAEVSTGAESDRGTGSSEETDHDPVDDLPYISTQAAMQDAHRALFDASSPLSPQEGIVDLPLETPSRLRTSQPSSPIHTITPFHQFNAEIANGSQGPLPSTQALLDGFYSPIKLSTKKSSAPKRASFAPSTIPEGTETSVASSLGLLHNSANSDGTRHESVRPGAEPDLPSLADERNDSRGDGSPIQDDSPDFIAPQKSSGRSLESRSLLLAGLQQQSIRLSDVFEAVSSQRGIDINSLLSQGTPSTSSKSQKKKKNRKSAPASQPKPRERKIGQRRSMRVSLSQPDYRIPHESDFESESGPEQMTSFSLSHPLPSNPVQSFGIGFSTIPDQSSTIPDPSLAINHLNQDDSLVSDKPTSTSGGAQQSTATSSFQHAQRSLSLLDVDSTIEDLQQTFLRPWDVETAMRDPAAY